MHLKKTRPKFVPKLIYLGILEVKFLNLQHTTLKSLFALQKASNPAQGMKVCVKFGIKYLYLVLSFQSHNIKYQPCILIIKRMTGSKSNYENRTKLYLNMIKACFLKEWTPLLPINRMHSTSHIIDKCITTTPYTLHNVFTYLSSLVI